MRRVLGWILVFFLIFYIIRSPTAAAANVKSIGAGIGAVIAAFGNFLGSLVK
jgi:hypothetical protein